MMIARLILTRMFLRSFATPMPSHWIVDTTSGNVCVLCQEGTP